MLKSSSFGRTKRRCRSAIGSTAYRTKAQAKCLVKLGRLEQMGHELRRPEADYLRDDIYELRVRFQSVNYRMLYFFHGRTAAVVSHGIVKEKEVPPKEIDLAVKRKRVFEANPEAHSEYPT